MSTPLCFTVNLAPLRFVYDPCILHDLRLKIKPTNEKTLRCVGSWSIACVRVFLDPGHPSHPSKATSVDAIAYAQLRRLDGRFVGSE